MDYKRRQRELLTVLEANACAGMLVTHMPNVRYLSGFTGSSGVLAMAAGKLPRLAFFTDGRYTQQAREQVKGAKVFTPQAPALSSAMDWLKQQLPKNARVAFEADRTTVSAQTSLRKLNGGRLRFVSSSNWIERIRTIKEPEEIKILRSAILLGSGVFEAVLPDIKPGVTESRIAAEIEYLSRRLGAQGMAFDTLVSAGKRSALPHGVASSAQIPAKGFVIIDMGVIVAGYRSDMTRTVHMGQPDKKSLKIYDAVLRAQLAAIETVKAGVETWEVDQAARKSLEKDGLAEYFTHSSGHGVGLEIHELPGLRKAAKGQKKPRKPSPDALRPGMVITIEPGAYVPGVGGVRIEDMVLVTETGCQILTPTRKDLIVL
jgi:Xaa-Pro aminopeptidase